MVKEDRKNHHCRSTFKTSTIRVQKDVDLKTCFFIYRQSKNTKTSDTNGTRNAGDSDGNEDFKTEYTNNTKMMTADIVSAIDQNEVSCPRCRYIMHHAQKPVRQLSVAERIFPNNICEHCQAKAKDPFPKTKEELVYSRLKSEGKLLRRRKKEKNTFVSLSNIRRDLQKSKLPRIDPRITPLISSLKLDDKSLSDVESPVNQDSNILIPPKYDSLEEESGICIKTKKAHDKRFFAGNKDDDMEKKKLDEKREKAETLNKKQRKEGILDSSTGEKEKYSKRKLSKTSETELSKIDDGINQDKKKRQKYNDNEASGKDRKGVNYEERTYNKKKENENEKIDKEKPLPGKGLSSPGKGKKRSGNDIVSPKDISNRDKTLSFPEEGLHKEEEQNKKKWYLEPGKEKKMPVKGEVLTAVEKRLPVSKKNSDKEEALLPSKQISDKEKSLSPHKKGLQEQQVENEDKSYKKKELPTFEKELLHGKKEGKSDEEQIRYLASGQKEKHTLDGAKKEKLNNSKTKINVIPADDELLVGKMDKTKPKPLKSKSITRPAAIKPRHKKLENIESRNSLKSESERHLKETKEKSLSVSEMVYKNKIIKKPNISLIRGTPEKKERAADIVCNTTFTDDVLQRPSAILTTKVAKSQEKAKLAKDSLAEGICRYTLSDRTFIEKGWTLLPIEKVVRKTNVYRMRPAHPEFNWFEHNKVKGIMYYDTGEKLAEFKDNSLGQWFYRNGKLALNYYDAEDTNAQQRIIIFSNGERDKQGRSRPITILGMFDYVGNGVIFDHSGKIRLKYNQTEGVVLDREIGPASHWKWHSLNDPPVLQQVMIDTQMLLKDPRIVKLGSGLDAPRPEMNKDKDVVAIEFANTIKEKNEKMKEKFKPFQIKMKALKINENFSIRILDQASIYLLFRDGTTNLKLNLGMLLDNREIIDTETEDLGEISTGIERLPAKTESLRAMQHSINCAQRFERNRTEHERRLRLPEPAASIDRMKTSLSKPLKPPLTAVNCIKANDDEITRCYSRKPSICALYYNNRIF